MEVVQAVLLRLVFTTHSAIQSTCNENQTDEVESEAEYSFRL